MKIIGLSGKIYSGKDYIAQYIEGAFFISFADMLKSELATILNIPCEYLYDRVRKEEYRHDMQNHGTRMREIDKNYWIDKLFTILDILNFKNNFKIVVIPDVRYKNEADAIRKRGGTIVRIEAPLRSFQYASSHPSETDLDEYPHDIVINNDYGVLADEEEIRKIIKKILA